MNGRPNVKERVVYFVLGILFEIAAIMLPFVKIHMSYSPNVWVWERCIVGAIFAFLLSILFFISAAFDNE